jgi:predicted ATPase/DNA-binding XRE family transcriptional regulator
LSNSSYNQNAPSLNNTLPFHEWLKKRRKALDLTHDKLAYQVGCSPNTLRKLESGERRPSQQLAERLARHLGVAPEELPAFMAYARTGSADTAPAPVIPPLPSVAPAPPSLPSPSRPLTRLIGRAALLAEVKTLLQGQAARLVTLTGPGGVGKTRLAQEIAADLHERFADGALFVPLTTFREPAAALDAVAQALDLAPDVDRSPAAVLRDALRERELLLVLDNLEQVIELGPSIAELLAACPRLHVLASSRVALLVRGEQLVLVPPLALPAEAAPPDLDLLAQIPAVALFVERAQAVAPRFALAAENAQAVADICRRLDGLPLAIELAAARLRVLPPALLLQRLGRRLPILVGGARDLPERHQTLRGTIAWSCELLSAEERELFARLAVFVGGASLDAVTGVCAGPDAEEPLACLNQLQALADHSLIHIIPEADGARFTMLAVIQEYAAELLAASGQEREVRLRHARWCHDLCAQAFPMLNQADQHVWIQRLEAEHDNLRAALGWLLADERPGALEEAAGLLWPLHRFWYTCGHLSEGLRWMELALARAAELPAPLRADLLYGAAVLAAEHRQMAQAEAWVVESLDCSRALGRRAAVAAALPLLSSIREQQGDRSNAEALAAESVAIFRELGDGEGLGDALDRLAQCAYYAGDMARAIRLQEEVLALRRGLGNMWLIGSALNNLGVALHESGQPERALPLVAEAVALVDRVGNTLVCARMQINLGSILTTLGDSAAAAACYAQSLALIWSHRDLFALAWLLRDIATLLVPSDPAAAARLFGKAEVLMGQDGWQLPPFDRQRLDAALDELRLRLEPAAYAMAWHAGALADLAPLVAQAADLVAALACAPPPVPRSAAPERSRRDPR